jgi:acetyl-CoA carboxylase beta subunit
MFLTTWMHCRQCGKEFKPQELHSHMQSCRGFKERMRSSTSARPSADRRRNWPTAGHYSSEPSAVFLLTES